MPDIERERKIASAKRKVLVLYQYYTVIHKLCLKVQHLAVMK